MILPGKTIGILGGGQLGRMLAQAAQTLGYRVHVYDPEPDGPAAAVAAREFNASYDDIDALVEFARTVDVVTYEFENIAAAPLQALAGRVPLRPGADVLYICQNRQREKSWLKAKQFPHVAYAEALDGDIASAVAVVGQPCVVKTADFGYDGKGQMKITSALDLEQAVAIFRGRRCVVEKWCEFVSELSVIVARGVDGSSRAFPPAENIHQRHILEVSIAPGRFSPAVSEAARVLATRVADALGVVGLLAVEFFLTAEGDLLINELAPRPHNSGHWSLDGAETSQFEQHIRAICGLPLGEAGARQPTVMANILGDAWTAAERGRIQEPNWPALLAAPRVRLHLYGKAEPRPGRKMGHFTVRDADIETALARARELQARL